MRRDLIEFTKPGHIVVLFGRSSYDEPQPYAVCGYAVSIDDEGTNDECWHIRGEEQPYYPYEERIGDGMDANFDLAIIHSEPGIDLIIRGDTVERTDGDDWDGPLVKDICVLRDGEIIFDTLGIGWDELKPYDHADES